METSDLELGEPEDDCESQSSVEDLIHSYQLSDKKALVEPYNAGDQTLPLSSQQELRSHKHSTTEPVYCSTQSTGSSSSSSHQDQGETNGTSGYNTGSRVPQSEPTETTGNCYSVPNQGALTEWKGETPKQPINREPSKQSISKESSKPSISKEPSKPSISKEPSTQCIRRDLASNTVEPSGQSTKTVPTRGPSGVSEPQSDIVPCEQESTSREGGGGMLVSGFSLVLPRNTLISFCSQQR